MGNGRISYMSQVSWELVWWYQRKMSLSHKLVWKLVINPWCVKRKSGLWPRKRQMEGKSANGDSLLWWWPLVLTTYWVWVMASSDLLLRPPGRCGSIWTQRRLSHSNISVPNNSFCLCFNLIWMDSFSLYSFVSGFFPPNIIFVRFIHLVAHSWHWLILTL